MKQKLTLLILALVTSMGAWAQITVSPSTGVYWKNGAVSTDTWAPIWKSNAKTADASTPLLVLTAGTGINTSYGDIYASTYTLEAPSGYVISDYTFNGIATGGDVTITPAGGAGTTITNGNSLGEDLSVTVRARTTTFTLTGSGHVASLNLVVTVSPIPVTIAYCPGYVKNTSCDHNFPNQYGTFSGQTYTTLATSGFAGVTITASSGLTIGGTSLVNSTNYGKCFSFATNVSSTNYTVTLTAPSGYVITGYYLACCANTDQALHTLTAADGTKIVVNTPGNNSNSPWPFEVTGLNANSTSFTINTASKANTLYVPIFQIYVAKASEVVNDTYNVIFNGTQVATKTVSRILGTTTSPTLPSVLQRELCTYEYYSNEACTTPLSTLTTSGTTIYAKCTCNYPFTVSSSFATATWYYAKINSSKYLRADDDAKDGSGRFQTNSTNGRTDEYKWAFFGSPYDNIYVMNRGQGSGKYLYKGDSQPEFKTLADPTADNKALWVVRNNSQGGFALQNVNGGTNWCINDAGGAGNLGYWNNTLNFTAAGSNWVVEEVSASDHDYLGSKIDEAQALVDHADVPGYINSTAASTLSSAISTAQDEYDDPSGDWVDAASTLATAITTATASANIVYTPRTDVYYTILNARGAMVYDSSHSGNVDTTNDNAEYVWYGSTTPDDTNANNLWGFIEQEGHYYMYNVGKQQFATVGTGTYGSTWIFSDIPAYITLDDGIADEIAVPKVRVRATIATTETTYTMSVSTNYTGPVITYDANGDGGVPMLFAESSKLVDDDVTDIMTSKVTDLTPYRNGLQGAIDAITIGSGLNEYVATSAYTTALADAQAVLDDNTSTKGELQDAKSNLEATFSGLTLNMPASNKFYRIKGKTSGNYLASGGGVNNSKFTMTSATDATTIFYYDGTILTNLSTGMCNGMSSSAWAWVVGESASTVVFQDGLSNGGYGIKSADCNFYDSGSTADRGKDLTLSGANIRYRDWYLTEITTLPIAIGSTTYATLCAPVALTIPTNVKAYYISEVAEKSATLTEISTTIAANTPVILKAATPGTYSFATTTGGTDVSSSNKLEGSAVAITVAADEAYTLQRNEADTETGLFPKAAGTIAGFKAYLPAETVPEAGVKGFTFIFEDNPDAISLTPALSEGEGAIYNLAGQRLNKMQKGINIVNGKKILK